MAKGVSHLGIGLGLIYATTPDGVSVLQNINNDSQGERGAKLLGAQSFAESVNRIATGTITVTASVVAESVTGVTINAVNQLSASVATTATTADLATAIASAINEFTPATGPDYTASVNGSVITLYADEASGSDVNGLSITMASSNPATITFTTTDIDGGSNFDADSDEASGYRFFLDADYGTGTFPGDGIAQPGDLTNAIEITQYVVPKHLNGAINSQSVNISSGNIALARKSSITEVVVDTEASVAADDLDSIDTQGFAIGDILILKGDAVAQVTTVKDGVGNINLRTGDFVTGGRDSVILLQLNRQTTSSPQEWYEVSRSTQQVPVAADFRSNGYPVGVEGVATIAVPTGAGTTTLVAGTDTVYQLVTGTGTRTADYSIDFDATAIAGDRFTVEYNGTFTAATFTLTIGGIVLTDTQLLTGGWVVEGYYNGVSWESYIVPNMRGTGVVPKVETVHINDDAVTVAKVEESLTREMANVSVSFEAGELGDYKMVMPYPGSVVKIECYVTKLIEATDDGQICVKDDSAAVMATIDILSGTAIGVGFNNSPTTNNTFVKDDVLTFNTAKPTAGGKVFISVEIERS